MELKENNKFKKLLRGNSFVTGNIIFDDEEIIIQRDAKAFWYSFVLALFILMQPISVFLWGTNGYKNSMYNYHIFLLFVGATMLFLSLFKIFEIRKTSNIAFPIKDLKSISVISRKKSHIRISIQLNNSQKTSVTVHNDTYFRDFIDTIRKYNVEIK
jgi:hypothetical protein